MSASRFIRQFNAECQRCEKDGDGGYFGPQGERIRNHEELKSVMEANVIEQADKIVFGDERTGEKLHNTLHANGVSMNTMRRGAYAEYMATTKSCMFTLFGLDSDIGAMANAIVTQHAATQPKGDGLPEGLTAKAYSNSTWRDGLITEKTIGAFVRTDDLGQADKVAQYLNRCLSKPVRRLLAEFEVVEPTSDQKLRGEAFVVSTHTAACLQGHKGPVCWLVPKSRKD